MLSLMAGAVGVVLAQWGVHAIRDAIEGASLPVIEVHISNVHARDEWRHHSVVSPLARGIIVGFGVLGYSLALTGLYQLAKAEGRV